ncbi:hypothetical protein [Clostridium sp.]|uniref:hypothetical protein n=1 Tax=Clostridium sp. TaxID=1506 RepID=UPI00284B0869|nr:hypothetical protein [Clostridium sp.]MDR3598082.1 hypothetical protein [Clostridium sp.]
MFSLSEKFIRLINKMPKPVVISIGIVMIMNSDVAGRFVNDIIGKGGRIADISIWVLGMYILFSPSEYKFLKTSHEIIDDKDERIQMIKGKTSEKVSAIMTVILCILILVFMPIEKGVAVLLGILLIIENTLKYIIEKKYIKIM